jgi:hypothetical protein
MIIVKESGMGRVGLTRFGIVGGTVDEKDIEPAIVVVVKKADSGADVSRM